MLPHPQILATPLPAQPASVWTVCWQTWQVTKVCSQTAASSRLSGVQAAWEGT